MSPRETKSASLFFDTASYRGAIALEVRGSSESNIFRKDYIGGIRAENLVSDLKGLLAAAELSIDDVTKCHVNVGPGSFMGVRVALSFAKGLIASNPSRECSLSTFSSLQEMRTHLWRMAHRKEGGLGSEGDLISEVVVIQSAKDSYTLEFAPGAGVMKTETYNEDQCRELLLDLIDNNNRMIILEEPVAKHLGLHRNIHTVPSIIDLMLKDRS